MKKLLYKLALKIIASRIVDGTQLTPAYLEEKEWVWRNGYYIDPRKAGTDEVSIRFKVGKPNDKVHYYCVYHGFDKKYMTTESTVEWLELWMLCMNKRRKLNKLI